MKNYLLLTLGHNASAAFVNTKGKVIAYEQERLDGIKASSQFPQDAIAQIIKHVGFGALSGCAIRISHWFDFSNKNVYSNKYITDRDMNNLLDISDDIDFVSPNFTHHDAHAFSVHAFMKHYLTFEHVQKINGENVFTIVADGFGNNGEVLSIYKSSVKQSLLFSDVVSKPSLLHRVYGYKNSLGLMYQFATGFCGMKENQDEYKFLGYEAHIDSYVSCDELDRIGTYAIEKADSMLYSMLNDIQFPGSSGSNSIDLHELSIVRESWNKAFASLLEGIGMNDRRSFASRCIIAFYIQTLIEYVICKLAENFAMRNVNVAGGIFYNVKLNNALLKYLKGTLCVMPLAGDQGAAFGIYEHEKEGNVQIDFSDLCYGERDLYAIDKLMKPFDNARLVHRKTSTMRKVVDDIANLINSGKIVNIINGPMEFGPRALCNTSTIFLPTSELVAENNHNNARNEVMPCAPVILAKNAGLHFDAHELQRVIGSNKFMICTHDYVSSDGRKLRMQGGVMHKKPLQDVYTGRPQIVTNGLIVDILENLEKGYGHTVLVNTSFNAHGQPIVFNAKQIVDNYAYQVNHCGKNVPYLYVII